MVYTEDYFHILSYSDAEEMPIWNEGKTKPAGRHGLALKAWEKLLPDHSNPFSNTRSATVIGTEYSRMIEIQHEIKDLFNKGVFKRDALNRKVVASERFCECVMQGE